MDLDIEATANSLITKSLVKVDKHSALLEDAMKSATPIPLTNVVSTGSTGWEARVPGPVQVLEANNIKQGCYAFNMEVSHFHPWYTLDIQLENSHCHS